MERVDDEIHSIENENGTELMVGDLIATVGCGEYDGLYGHITDITEPTDTGNPSEYDVHCRLMPPFFPKEREELEKRFSILYKTEKKMEDISLDDVILDPDEMYPIGEVMDRCVQSDIYVLRRLFEDGETRTKSVEAHTAFDNAKYGMIVMCKDDIDKFLSEWKQKEGFHEEWDELSYKAWVDGENKRYKVYVETVRLWSEKDDVDELVTKFAEEM